MVSRLTQSRGLFRCWRKFVVYPFLVEEFCDSADLRQQPMLPVASHRAMPENRWRWSDRPESGARCGCSSMVEHRPSKPGMGVRFRPPAPRRSTVRSLFRAGDHREEDTEPCFLLVNFRRHTSSNGKMT